MYSVAVPRKQSFAVLVLEQPVSTSHDENVRCPSTMALIVGLLNLW